LARRFLSLDGVEELTSRKNAADIPKTLDRLELSFGSDRKVGRPIDVLLATNMISVGVDVSRLGLMIVAGQPKTTAEYIQATSRVGRRHPGLVLVVYNWARPRDLSHYERFEHYHATFYKQVEPLSVTPFSARALDRGLTGVLVALIRLNGERFNPNDSARLITAADATVTDAIATISRRAALATASVEDEQETRKRIDETHRYLAEPGAADPHRLQGRERRRDAGAAPAGRGQPPRSLCLPELAARCRGHGAAPAGQRQHGTARRLCDPTGSAIQR
jgi:superfamily II DNA or RNA helicase